MAQPPFSRVLVANRGEIAVRVVRGLRELGVRSVAIASDVDVNAPHALLADACVAIGGSSAAESYLDIDKVVRAAIESGAEAVHPGYGFLSENPAFVRAVEGAGLVFIGPPADAMALLGSKAEAKRAAAGAGVPVVPGFDEDAGDDGRLATEAAAIGYPLLIKAVAGGGGKGMRLVSGPAQFREALAAARREALAAFGSDRVLLEKYVRPARHVEIQVLADHHGHVLSLHERECSVQRRHQKVLEEAPSPAVDPDLRQRMGQAAVALARAVGYRGAGTVEFLLDDRGRFYFLEVNTRLQVEHPVTEMVLALDLVHLQVRIAAGASLRQLVGEQVPPPRGWALEARIYAEAPERGFLPAAGTLRVVREPCGPGIRVDSGVVAGQEVTVHYDPMLAKLVVWGADREQACTRMAQALRDSTYLGIPTNVDFLRRVVEDEVFRAGRLHTGFLDDRPDLSAAPAAVPDPAWIAAVLGGAALPAPAAAAVAAGLPEVWQAVGGLRLWEGGA